VSDSHGFAVSVQWPAPSAGKPHPDPAYSRANTLGAAGHPGIAGSAPEVFGGEPGGYNPEELLTLSLSQCHMLTYLAIAARRGLTVRRYEDRAQGTLAKGPSGKMQMVEVVLHPRVTVARGSKLEDARAFHERAHSACFIANSVNFPVRNEPEVVEE
jgi:organic hydroperoxide reductase OsmC/OhrA